MAEAPPRRSMSAFSGGPLGIGWAPLAIGAGAIVLGIFFFMRRGQATAASQSAPQPLTAAGLPAGQPYPYPTGPPPPPPTGSTPPPPNLTAQQMQAVTQGGTKASSAPSFTGSITREIPAGSIFPILPPLVPERAHPEWTSGWYRTTQGDWVTAGEIYVLPSVSGSQLGSFAAGTANLG